MIFGRNRRGEDEAGVPARGRGPSPRAGRLPRFAIPATDDAADLVGQAGALTPAQQRLALADALAPAQPVTVAERFAGRTDALEALIAAIEQQRAHVVLYGERGIGKTSLVHVFAETAREARYLVFYGSCGVEASFDEMFRAFASQIPLLYHADVSPTADEDEHGRSFADLIGDGSLDPRALADLFGRLVGTRVILILDEYDRVEDLSFRRNVAELIKNLSDRAARVQLVLAGVALNLEELIGFTPSIRRNLVGLGLGAMQEEGMRDILANAEAATGLVFAAEAQTRIVTMAAGSPYLVRLLGLRAASLALDAGRTQVTAEDVVAGTRAVLAEWKLGLPRHVQRLLLQPETEAAWPLLIAAARASGTPDGTFTVEDLESETGGNAAEIRRQLDAFTRGLDFFEPATVDEGEEPRYRFRTQGLAQLLALSAALARLDA